MALIKVWISECLESKDTFIEQPNKIDLDQLMQLLVPSHRNNGAHPLDIKGILSEPNEICITPQSDNYQQELIARYTVEED